MHVRVALVCSSGCTTGTETLEPRSRGVPSGTTSASFNRRPALPSAIDLKI